MHETPYQQESEEKIKIKMYKTGVRQRVRTQPGQEDRLCGVGEEMGGLVGSGSQCVHSTAGY